VPDEKMQIRSNSFPPGELEETIRMTSHHMDEEYPAGSGII